MSGRLGIYSQAAGGETPAFAFGNALQFDGINDYVSVTETNSLPEYTISSWFKVDSFNTFFASNSNSFVNIWMRFSTRFYVRDVSGGLTASFAFPALSVGTWNHFALVGTGGNARMYINGVESTSLSQPLGNMQFANLGKASTSYFGGIIDETSIWTSALTAGQISNQYNSGNGNYADVDVTPLVWLKLNESGTATTAVDSSGNGNDGTLNNFPASGMWVVHLPYNGADVDANAYINAGEIIDFTEIAAIEQMFLDLKGTGSTTNNSNIYNDLIAFYPISPTSLAAASVNAINPGTYNIIWNNMVAGDLTADGIQGNNSSKYGDTQIPMNTLRGVGNSFGCNVHTPGTINSRNYMGAYNSGSLFYGVFKSSADVRAYSASATAFVSLSGDANLAGNIVVDRALSTGFSAYVDGLSDGGAAASEPSVTATNPNIFLLGEGRSSGLSRPTDARINIAIIANSLSLNQHKDYQDSIAKYLLNR